MRKFLIAILVLSLFPFASAFAITEGDYVWNDQTITVTAINTTPMFAPVGITSNQRAIAIDMLVSTELWQDDAISDALFAKTRLEDGNGASYAPVAAMSSTKNPTMTYVFGIPKNADIDGLQLVFQSEGSTAVIPVINANAETAPEEISLVFEGKSISCRPIAFTHNDVGAFILIMHMEGLSDFVMSQRYNVMAPIYACILNDQGKPLYPNRIILNKDIKDCAYFFYEVEQMPETLSLVPLDSVDDTTAWHTLTLAYIPSEVPNAYVLPPDDWNGIDDQPQAD